MATDPSVEAKLKRMMAELEREQRAQSPPVKGQKTAIKHHLLDWKNRFVLPIELLAIPWAQFIINQVYFGGRWNWVVIPRDPAGISGIFLAAFSHESWSHLISNTVAFAIFSWLILAKSKRDYWITLLIGWLGGGFAGWLFGLQSAHGLSGVVYTLFGYLLAIGWLERRLIPLAISVFVIINFSYAIWGIFPTVPRVAWWGHLYGFLLGLFAAYGVYREPHRANREQRALHR